MYYLAAPMLQLFNVRWTTIADVLRDIDSIQSAFGVALEELTIRGHGLQLTIDHDRNIIYDSKHFYASIDKLSTSYLIVGDRVVNVVDSYELLQGGIDIAIYA